MSLCECMHLTFLLIRGIEKGSFFNRGNPNNTSSAVIVPGTTIGASLEISPIPRNLSTAQNKQLSAHYVQCSNYEHCT